MDIEDIKGIGPKTAQLFKKLNIRDTDSLITFYPYRYVVYNFDDISELNNNISIVIMVKVESNPNVMYIKKNFNKMSFRAITKNKIINVVIFNRAFLKNKIIVGSTLSLIGKYDCQKNLFTCSDIKFNIVEGTIEPIYHTVNGLTSSTINAAIKSALASTEIIDNLPSSLIESNQLISKEQAINSIHFPKNLPELNKAKKRLIYEEFFDFSFKMNYLTSQNRNSIGQNKIFDKNLIDNFILNLPYKLTVDQDKAINEILNDLSSSHKMNRILLGDVGSGKTIVAIISIYANYLAGYQSAMMVPTEILAKQHYESITKLLGHLGLKIAVITGSLTAKEKKSIYEQISNNMIDVLIGTHAILSDNISFKNLGLIITDEQHRFGVNQRKMLQNKTEYPDILYLSATPIPRTYALTIYGDLNISFIKSKPAGRKEITTILKKESEIKDVLSMMLEELKQNHQIYVVAPAVEENDNINSVATLKDKIDIAFKHLIPIEIIHGKMKQKDKDQIMSNFKNNITKILIATSVIEVGIDIANASMIVMFNAERFGLASLHQLRGRVGRSDLDCKCILISNYDTERLKVMEQSNDGFYIAQKDFELRGHGDLFGIKQSGDMVFKIGNLKNDFDILTQAKRDSQIYLESQKYLTNSYYNDLANSINIVD